jgi:hypothetical protein
MGCAYTSGIFVMAEGPDFSKQGLFLLVGDYLIRQLVLYEKDFGWMAVWELNLEVLESLWLMMAAVLGASHCGRKPLLNYTVAFALQLRKTTGNLCQGSDGGGTQRDYVGWQGERVCSTGAVRME